MAENDKKSLKTRLDKLENLVTGLGIEGKDRRYYTSHVDPGVYTTSSDEESIFRGDSIANRIIAKPAADMVKKWFDLKIGDDKEASKKTLSYLKKIKTKQLFREAITWARKSGCGIVFMGIDDGKDSSRPVDVDGIRSIKWLKALERHDLEIKTVYTNPMIEKFGQPETYEVINRYGGSGLTIHESRILRFDGVLTTETQKARSGGWNDGVLLALEDPLKDTGAAFAGMMSLLAEGPQGVLKIKDLANLLTADSSGIVSKRIATLDLYRSQYRSIPLDADSEDFNRLTLQMSGVPEGVDRAMVYLSACSGIPVTVLFGRSPAGMNATGESDLEIYYGWIAEQQEELVMPALERLIELVFLAQDGPVSAVPEEYSIEFKPLWVPTEKETAEIRSIMASADGSYLSGGVLTPEEIRESRFGSRYSLETSLNPESFMQSKIPEEKQAVEENPEKNIDISSEAG